MDSKPNLHRSIPRAPSDTGKNVNLSRDFVRTWSPRLKPTSWTVLLNLHASSRFGESRYRVRSMCRDCAIAKPTLYSCYKELQEHDLIRKDPKTGNWVLKPLIGEWL